MHHFCYCKTIITKKLSQFDNASSWRVSLFLKINILWTCDKYLSIFCKISRVHIDLILISFQILNILPWFALWNYDRLIDVVRCSYAVWYEGRNDFFYDSNKFLKAVSIIFKAEKIRFQNRKVSLDIVFLDTFFKSNTMPKFVQLHVTNKDFKN